MPLLVSQIHFVGCELVGGCASAVPCRILNLTKTCPFFLLLLPLLFFLAIVNGILNIVSLDFIPVRSETLEELAKTATTLEGSVSLSQLAACQLGDSTYCPDGLTEADVTCQLEYLNCEVNQE